MAARSREARRRANTPERQDAAWIGEVDPTPTPRPVAVDIPSDPHQMAKPSAHGLVAALKRLAVSTGVVALVGLGALALRGAPTAVPAAARGSAVTAARLLAVDATDRLLAAVEAGRSMMTAATDGSAAAAQPRADAHVDRTFYGHLPGGVLFVPRTFSSVDGSYDLYLHFHGNTRVVLESAEHAGLNAVVGVVNLGINSAPYLDAYQEPGSYERLLAAVDRAVAERGLVHRHLRRVAWGSWSGGYGAVSRIFELGRGLSNLDAVLVLDGIHCGYLEENPKALNVRIISPFVEVARQAAQGKLLFSITHSEIEPPGYAGSHVTAGYLLDLVGGHRGAPREAPEHLNLRSAEGAVPRKLEKRMEPLSEARVGSLHVRGYRGNTPEHHMAHLLQMGATTLPELVERWRTEPRP